MEKKELQELAKRVQLEIKEEDFPAYLDTFKYLEKPLANLKKAKIGKKVKPMERIKTGHLTLKDLEKIAKKLVRRRISKKLLESNAKTTSGDFILFIK